ncbi:MAG: phosphocholine cytidylyltransferase family protein [Candidatus Helarchaeota archaeon]
MEAIFLAAGNGTRMGEFTVSTPKPLISLNGVPIIDYILRNLLYLDVERLIFVIGYQGAQLKHYLTENYSGEIELQFVKNDRIERENGYSLLCARKAVREDHFFVLMADHLVETKIYASVMDKAKGNDIVLGTDQVAQFNDPDEATKVLLEGDRIVAIGKNLNHYSAFDTGVFVMSRNIFPELMDFSRTHHIVKLSDFITHCINRGLQVVSCDVTENFWIDLDTTQDIDYLLQVLAQTEEHISDGEIY